MQFTPFNHIHQVGRAACLCLAVATCAVSAYAQTVNPSSADANVRAQQTFNADLSVCNSAGFPEPQRALCVRDAGLRFDRLRGVPEVAQPAQSADGRATVMTPSSASTTLRGSTTATTSDGRATVVVPEPSTTN